MSAGDWVRASRPATLTAALAPVAVGTACAHALGGARWLPALAALAGATWIQIGTNFANDVFDAEKGADGPERLGPTRAVSAGLISAGAMRAAMILAFSMAALCGVYLIWVGGWAILALGVASIASGIAYTGGPYPLGYHGLGDLFVLAFFGLAAVSGTAYVQLGHVPPLALVASIPVGALATAILVVNNVRDRETDARAGKRTLAVRLGKRGALVEQAILFGAAYAVPAVLALEHGPWLLLPWVTSPLALALWLQLRAREGQALNATLAATARLGLAHGVLFALAIALASSS